MASTHPSDQDLPLQGVRVLDLSRVFAGPMCAMVLADFGAEVVKVEHPGRGDDTRDWGLRIGKTETTYYNSMNRNKRSITVDLQTPEGVKIIHSLLPQCDVVIQNFKTGGAEKLGLGYEQLKAIKPDLIYCAVAGYDVTGPEASRPGYDLVIQGEAGLMALNGEAGMPPRKFGVAVVDAPSDRRDLNGGFRASLEHAEDAAAVIAFLRTESSLPVWAIGTSNGSLSAANAAVRLGPRGPNGIVLTSATTSHAPNPSLTHLVTDASLAEIGVPVLWVHHRIDECKHTPFDAIPPLVASMKKAARADLIPVEGGDNSPRGNRSTPCSSGYHQFQGIEAEVTKRIADWIKKEQGAK